jgi:hypothetical protein
MAVVLAEYRAARDMPGAWNSRDDCIGWAGNVARALLGFDAIADIRGVYASEAGARRAMVERGWHSLAEVAGAYFAEVPVAQARTGDWAIILNDGGVETIGVFCGATIAAKTASGMAQVPRGRAIRAFRVE